MANNGKYGENLDAIPTQGKGESRDAYNQRLKDWQRKRSRGGSKPGGAAKAPEKRLPRATELPLHSNPGGWMDKVVTALGGNKK